ncbi:MAG: hypothetical protein ACP5IY_05505, partial [Halothiobacillaceae bacterium]
LRRRPRRLGSTDLALFNQKLADGLISALVMLGLRYDSEAGRQHAAVAMQTIRDAAYGASIELAREKGPFPFFERAANSAASPFRNGQPPYR